MKDPTPVPAGRYDVTAVGSLKPLRTWLINAAVLIALVIALYSRAFHPGPQPHLQQSPRHSLASLDEPWSRLRPSTRLDYQPCFVTWFCARLLLPLDWHDPSNNNTVAIAIVRLPARVPVTDPRYGGPIFINPGGPGGSGVAKAFKDGPRMQQAADYLSASDEQTPSPNLNSKYFDIIGFDPRGVNHSTPKLLCFPDSAAREAWQLQESAEGIIGSSDAAFERKWARWGSFVGSCMQRVASDDASDIALHMNTAPVAADILEIAERHAEWRQTQAESWLSSLSGRLSTAGARSSDPNSRESIRTRTEWKRGFERVSYWGISYGSVLASTFAAMFPDRVSRFILDGVEDPQEHYTGVWNSSIIHADSAIEKFFQYCFDAGPKQCAMYDERGPDAMRTDFNSLLADIKVNALSVPASHWRGPEVITYSDIMKAFKDSLYTPIQSFPALARVVADVASRDGHSFADYKRFKSTPFARSKQCEAEGPYTTACMRPGEWQDEAEVGVQCGDGNNSIGETKERFLEYRRNLKNQSQLVGDIWSEYYLRCVGWSIRPKWRYSGPFEANTSHPLLMIANTLDPITPAKNAFRLSLGYQDSVVLQQDSVGHGSLSSPSNCTAKAIREYFQTGNLPSPGSICEVDEIPFLPRPESYPIIG